MKITLDDYHACERGGVGYCTSCGDFNEGAGGFCEADAENYECTSCGEQTLQGIMNAFFSGDLKVKGQTP